MMPLHEAVFSFSCFFFFLDSYCDKEQEVCQHQCGTENKGAVISNLIPRFRCVITQANLYFNNVVLKLIYKASSMNQL